MPLQKVLDTIAKVNDDAKTQGPFIDGKQIDAIEAAAGHKIGRQERANTYNFFHKLLDPNATSLVLVGDAEQKVRDWIKAHSPAAAAGPQDLQAQISAAAMQTAASQWKSQALAYAAGGGTVLTSVGAGAGIGFCIGGPFGAVVGGSIGLAIGMWAGPTVATAVQLHLVDAKMKEQSGGASTDPDDDE